MAVLIFPTILNVAYRQAMSLLRTDLVQIAETARKSPGIIPDIAAALAVLTAKLGVTLPAAGTPGQPTGLSAINTATSGQVDLNFAAGVNSNSFEWARSVDGGTTFSAWTALPANRLVSGLTLVSSIFRVRGVSVSGQGVASANSVAITIT